jgi:antitoxin MazE
MVLRGAPLIGVTGAIAEEDVAMGEAIGERGLRLFQELAARRWPALALGGLSGWCSCLDPFWSDRLSPAATPVRGAGVLPHRPGASIMLFIRLIPVAATPSRQALRRWGNSLGVRLPASIAREAQLQEDQAVELSVVEGGVMIRPVQRRLSLAERLAAYEPMTGEATEAMAFAPLGAEVIE